MIELKDFGIDEISELSRYIEVQVISTFLQRTYVLTENPVDKATNFITIFRVLESCKNYTTDDRTREKLNWLLKEVADLYNLLYPLVIRHENSKIEFGKSRLANEIYKVIFVPENNAKVSKLINAFLVFGEKIELNKVEDVMGIDLENDYGKDAMKEVRKVIESESL